MSLWGGIFAAMYDRFTAESERDTFAAHRATLLAGATGDVLEIGGGTGADLPYYGGDVDSLTITEPGQPMAKRLQQRINSARPEAKRLRAPAEDLPFDDDSFDVAVSTLVLCTVDGQPRALRELRRVLTPGGRLLFIEHVRSEDPKTARTQDRCCRSTSACATAAIATGRRSRGSARPGSRSRRSNATRSRMHRNSCAR
jgi:ubiquinone/menaquinone biosynthesis C-methylase UbiE